MHIRERLFLVSGADFDQRQRAIEALKRRILTGANSTLNTFIFYASEIDLKDFQEKVSAHSFNKVKIIHIKNFIELKSDIKKFIYENYKKILISNFIIFESDKDSYQLQAKKNTSDSLFSLVFRNASTTKVSSAKKKLSVPDFIYYLRKGDLANSLTVLDTLFEDKTKERILGPQILGILINRVNYVSSSKQREKLLEHLWQADRALKQKGFGARLILQTLLVKVLSPDKESSFIRKN